MPAKPPFPLRRTRLVLALAALGAAAAPLPAQAPTAPAGLPALAYSDAADLALGAPAVLVADIREAIRLKGEQAVTVPAGMVRLFVEADVLALVRGTTALPNRVRYLVDLPLDAKGNAPKLRKQRVILLATPVASSPGELRLVARDAQLAWSPAREQQLRDILRAAVDPSAPPRVTGIGRAFHVPGSLPGESETQIFLMTDDGRPVSLNVLRRPGERPRWAVALGEMVDDSAEPPARDTLLWYRLACGLPAALPARSVADLSPEERQAATEDYRLVVQALGPCGRTRS